MWNWFTPHKQLISQGFCLQILILEQLSRFISTSHLGIVVPNASSKLTNRPDVAPAQSLSSGTWYQGVSSQIPKDCQSVHSLTCSSFHAGTQQVIPPSQLQPIGWITKSHSETTPYNPLRPDKFSSCTERKWKQQNEATLRPAQTEGVRSGHLRHSPLPSCTPLSLSPLFLPPPFSYLLSSPFSLSHKNIYFEYIHIIYLLSF